MSNREQRNFCKVGKHVMPPPPPLFFLFYKFPIRLIMFLNITFGVYNFKYQITWIKCNLSQGTVVFPVTGLYSPFLEGICFCYFLCIVQHIFCCGSCIASCFTVSYQFIYFPLQCPPPVFFAHVSCFMPSAFLPSSAFEAFFLNYLSSFC